MASPSPTPYADLPDNELAVAARAGETAAWEELVRRHYSPLLRVLTGQTGDPETAADLAQEAFLAAWRQRDRFDPDRPFAPWLYGIARHAFLPWWRRQRLIRFASLEALAERADEVLSTMRRSDSNEVTAIEERDLIERATADLSPLLRQAFALHELGGLTTPEIAGILRISEAAAERRVGRAAAAFRRRYVELSGGAEGEGGGERWERRPGQATGGRRTSRTGT